MADRADRWTEPLSGASEGSELGAVLHSPLRAAFQLPCLPPPALTASMPRAIISPSVLASDFGQLTAECKRMIRGGAEWLHMGERSPVAPAPIHLRVHSPPLRTRRPVRLLLPIADAPCRLQM